MIRVKLTDDMSLSSRVWRYDEQLFMTRPLGGFLEYRTEPPFRDPESQLFIQEVDDGHLGDGNTYWSVVFAGCCSIFR